MAGTGADAMEQDGVDTIVAVERQVKTQVQQLHSVAALLRDLALAQDKYAAEYGKLPVGASSAWNLAASAPLQRVTKAFEATLTAVTQAHAALAAELTNTVVMPLEAFERQQKHQTKQLLSEIDDALQRERQWHSPLTSDTTMTRRGTVTEGDPVVDDNQDDAETSTTPSGADGPEGTMTTDFCAVKAKRDRERETVRQRLGELDLTDEQQAAIIQGQLGRCFDALACHAKRVLTEVSDALAAAALASSSQSMERDPLKLEDAVQVSNFHIEATTWMLAIVSQIIPVEEAMVKRLQTLLKSHTLETITTVFAPSNSPRTSSGPSSPELTTLWDLAQSHKQLTANLADPISRTLRFSRQKQETIRKELVESMDETQRQIQTARSRVRDKEAKLLQYLQQEQQRLDPPQQPVLGTTGTDALLAGGTLGLRNAVVSWTKQLSSPKKPLFKSKSVNGVGVFGSSGSPPKAHSVSPPTPTRFSIAKSPRRVNLEKDLTDARAHVQMLEEKERAQREDMIKALESTAHIGVKTMELMVNDYLKNVAKGMQLAAAAIAKCTATSGATKSTHDVFRSISLFDDNDCNDTDLAKQLGDADDKSPSAPEVLETEPEEAEQPDTAATATTRVTNTSDAVASVILTAKLATTSLPTEQAVRQRLRTAVTELRKLNDHLQVGENSQQILDHMRRVLIMLWNGLRSFVRCVEHSPEQWQCVVALAIVLSLLSFVRRLDRLDNGWQELAALQHENARSLEQLVALVGG